VKTEPEAAAPSSASLPGWRPERARLAGEANNLRRETSRGFIKKISLRLDRGFASAGLLRGDWPREPNVHSRTAFRRSVP
jgi:hypothetical protein